MNCFVLSADVKQCAKLHPDKLIGKMRLETCQMLAGALVANGLHASLLPLTKEGIPMSGKGWAKHPCTIWAGASSTNWQWLLDLGLALCDEKDARFGNKPQHCRTMLNQLRQLAEDHNIFKPTSLWPNNFAIAMPDWISQLAGLELGQKLASAEQAIKAYQLYLAHCKCHYANWAHSEIPAFWLDAINNDARSQLVHLLPTDGKLFCRYTKLKHPVYANWPKELNADAETDEEGEAEGNTNIAIAWPEFPERPKKAQPKQLSPIEQLMLNECGKLPPANKLAEWLSWPDEDTEEAIFGFISNKLAKQGKQLANEAELIDAIQLANFSQLPNKSMQFELIAILANCDADELLANKLANDELLAEPCSELGQAISVYKLTN